MDSNTVTPGEVASAFLERERGTRALLDDLDRAALEGNHDEVRERIRSFANEDRAVFLAVALSFVGPDEYLEGVEQQLDAETAQKLENLTSEYRSLAEPFKLVKLEETNDRTNPITSIDVQTAYSREKEVPFVQYTVSSGNVELYERKGTPQEVLEAAAYIIQGTNDSLAAALDAGHSVNTDELSGLIDRHQKLEEELNTLYDHIDELRRNPIDE